MGRRTKQKKRRTASGGFNLPPKVSVHKERIAGQWVYTFRHQELGQLGRIVLQTRADGMTQANCDLAGDPEEPMFIKRAAIFKPLARELMDKVHQATGGRPNVPLDERVVLPRPKRGVASKMIVCQTCRAGVAFLVFADGARSQGELEDYARLMFPKIQEYDLPTWVIGEAIGSDPPPERPADILKVWPKREPMRRQRPDEFNAMLDELIASHCG